MKQKTALQIVDETPPQVKRSEKQNRQLLRELKKIVNRNLELMDKYENVAST